jgi:hypothetical protein
MENQYKPTQIERVELTLEDALDLVDEVPQHAAEMTFGPLKEAVEDDNEGAAYMADTLNGDYTPTN